MKERNLAHFDVAIVGAGIAGAGLAAELSANQQVLLIERESAPGYHATGRSAALFSEIYGNDVVARLTAASRGFFEHSPAGFASHPLLEPRGCLVVARQDQMPRLAAHRRSVSTREVGIEEMRHLVPILHPAPLVAGLYDPDVRSIDVDGLLQGFLRRAKAQGVTLVCEAEIIDLSFEHAAWTLETRAGSFTANVVVNAAGAWAAQIGELAGASSPGLKALKRTMALVDPPAGALPDSWPFVVDVDEQFYFKADGGRLAICPGDETECEPADVQADELDVAIAVDRIQQVAELPVQRVAPTWAGLRTFAPDRSPVVGYDTQAPSFFWLAGQGGFGVQTAPALSRVGAALLQRRGLPSDIEGQGVAERLSPARFAIAAAA